MVDHLDHIAILVRDLDASARWYEEVLLLKPKQVKEWGRQPIMMQGGSGAVALFQAKEPVRQDTSNLHFAFRVSDQSYAAYVRHFAQKGISYYEEDHHHFQSLYLTDPEGYKVELTMLTPLGQRDFT